MDINQMENARCMNMFKYRCLSDSVIKKGQQQQQLQTNKQQNQHSFVNLNSDHCKDVVT